MRLGDLDALKKYMCEICNDEYSDEPCEPSDCVFCNAIKDTPTIDAVPVVRCADCKHYYVDEDYGATTCDRDCIHEPDASDFCSYGDRKDGNPNVNHNS